jgi:FKBP-type peptidyl-prolyl cis-trans isomerase
MRSVFVLLLLGVVLVTIAFVVRSGMLARHNPGRPINSAMRQALDGPQFSEEDALAIAQRYPNAHRLPSGMLYVVDVPGDGATPKLGSVITADYIGRLMDGTEFDSSYSRGKPLNFTLGVGQVIKGWDEAFLQMKKGEKRTLIIPYWLAYGESARGKIPAKATLIFQVQLIDFR